MKCRDGICRKLARSAVALAAAVGVGSCGGSAASSGAGTVTVFAASSLTEAFEAVGEEFHAATGTAVRLNFAGTPQLVAQIEQGAPGDVIASADVDHMDKLSDAGRLGSEPRVFARNRLELVVAAGNPRGVGGLEDLARTDLVVALCAPSVPAGRYTQRALARAGVVGAPDTEESNVKSVVAKVALGEVDVGVVYHSDVLSAGDRVAGVAIPDVHNESAAYPIATLVEAEPAADRFVAFVLSEKGRAILTRFGFGTP